MPRLKSRIAALVLLGLLAGCAVERPVPLPTAAPTAAPAASPASAPPPASTAASSGEPVAATTLPALPALPEPPTAASGAPDLPHVWLVVGERATLGTRGGFLYTIDLGNGSYNPVQADAGPIEEFPDLARAALPAGATAYLVVRGEGVAGARAAVLRQSVSGAWDEPLLSQGLVPVPELRSESLEVFALPAAGAGERLLSLSLSFSGPLHAGDYVSYYWRLEG